MVLEIGEAFTTCLLVVDENGNPASGKTISYRLFDETLTLKESGSMNELGAYGIYYKSWTPDVAGYWIFEAYYTGTDFKFYDIKMYPVSKGEEPDIDTILDRLDFTAFSAVEAGKMGERLAWIQQFIGKGTGTVLPSDKSLYQVIALDRLDNPTYGLNALLTAINNIDFTAILDELTEIEGGDWNGTQNLVAIYGYAKSAYDIVSHNTYGNSALKTLIDAVNTDLGDFSTQTNLKSLLQALGIPDTAGKPLYTCLITDRLDHATYGLQALYNLLINGTYGLAALDTDLNAILADTTQIADGSLPASPTAGSLARFIASGGTSLGTQLPASKSLYDALGNPFSDTLTSLRDKLGNLAGPLASMIQTAGAVNDASATVDSFISNLTNTTTDFYKGLTLIFTSGTLAGQSRGIVGYDGSTKRITIHPSLTSAPANSITFVIMANEYTGGLITGSKGLGQIYDLVDEQPNLYRVGDTITTDGTEQNLFYVDAPDYPFKGLKLLIDCTNMVAGDGIDIKEYYRIKSGGSYILKATYSYADAQTPDLKVIDLEPNTYGIKVTITRLLGSDRAYDYEVYSEQK